MCNPKNVLKRKFERFEGIQKKYHKNSLSLNYIFVFFYSKYVNIENEKFVLARVLD